MFKKIRKSRNVKRSKGAATVEFAMVAPIFFLIMFTSIEFVRVHMFQSAVENACFQAARRGILPGATSMACRTTAEDLIEEIGISNFDIEVEPAVIDFSTETIEVTATVPITSENGFGISIFFNDASMVKTITMPRQRR